jgi:hypothetical protein
VTELADLAFLVDELLLEHEVARRAECARQLYLHAYRGADLGPYVSRLLTVESGDAMTMRHTGWSLGVHAYRSGDAELVRVLLAGPHRLSLLALDHRLPVSAGSVGALVDHAAAAATDHDRSLAFTALSRLARAGADVAPLIPLLLEALGARPTGRGYKRVDLDAMARGMLTPFLGPSSPQRADLVAALGRLAAGKDARAKAARLVLAEAHGEGVVTH